MKNRYNNIKKIVELNPLLITEFGRYLYGLEQQQKELNNTNIKKKNILKKIYDNKNRKIERLFMKHQQIDPSLKLAKYKISLTISTIISGFGVTYVFTKNDQLFSIIPFMLASLGYLLASYYMSKKEVFYASKHESVSDFFLLIGICGLFVELYNLLSNYNLRNILFLSLGFYLSLWTWHVIKERIFYWSY